MSISHANNQGRHATKRRGQMRLKSRSAGPTTLISRTVPETKARFYFEESDGSLTPVYGNRTFPPGPPVGFVQTIEELRFLRIGRITLGGRIAR